MHNSGEVWRNQLPLATGSIWASGIKDGRRRGVSTSRKSFSMKKSRMAWSRRARFRRQAGESKDYSLTLVI
jgi:hypothetical protein